MRYTEKKFDLMLESAWRAFASTLMLHGMTKEEIEFFNEQAGSYTIKYFVEQGISSVVEWEDVE